MTTPVVHEIRPVVRMNGTPPIDDNHEAEEREHEQELLAVLEDCHPQVRRSLGLTPMRGMGPLLPPRAQ
jgi:hypothetical protein